MESLRAFLRRLALFVLIGLALYGAVYVANELVISRYAHRNRFFAIKNAPRGRYEHVILGASHAAVLGYRDLNVRLEQMTGESQIMNLSVVGGGVTVARLLIDYFLERHTASTAIYVVDSFAFYSRRWNEDRLKDTALYARAPFDPVLANLLMRNAATRGIALDYVAGFSKINNPERFATDIPPEEGSRFDRTYRPVPQIDRERVDYLYPEGVSAEPRGRYLRQLDDLILLLQERHIRFVAIKPPLPARVLRLLPDEAAFDAAIRRVCDRRGVAFHDFSRVGNDDRYFHDTDHLNMTGVLNFFETSLAPMLRY